jgi:hypothetical protein
MTLCRTLAYHLRIYRREHLWLPSGLLALFALLVPLMGDADGRDAVTAAAFLGYVVPLMGGILSASAVVEDTALELQLAAPRAPWCILAERLAVLLGIVGLGALAFQVYLVALGVDMSHLGNPLARQWVWFVPTLVLMGLASLGALAFNGGTSGALLAGGMWILQLLLRAWFMVSRWGRYLFLFLGERQPQSPYLVANQLILTGLALAFLAGSGLLLKRTERYL